jgi:hypothetical protein
MFLYNKSMYSHFKFKFPSLENIEQSYAQALQDMFVLSALKGKRNGVFLEIGAFEPVFISNTYLLDSQYGWKGISVEINPDCAVQFRNVGRSGTFVLGDALLVDYNTLLSSSGFGDRLDYLSLDIEPNTNTLACLKKIPLDKFRFSVITFETDAYDISRDRYVREKSRGILESFGYTLVAGNISNLSALYPFEDWYLDSSFFDKETIKIYKRQEDSPISANNYMLV